MNFPQSNKIPQSVEDNFQSNAELLEQSLKKIDWKFFVRFYFAALGCILAAVFGLVLVVRIALAII